MDLIWELESLETKWFGDLGIASDLGKAFGWCSSLQLIYVPLWVVMLMAAVMGLVGYGLQWAVIQELIYVPYFLCFGFV
ncbi:unnamed protein product [Rhodiola kirilowii]